MSVLRPSPPTASSNALRDWAGDSVWHKHAIAVAVAHKASWVHRLLDGEFTPAPEDAQRLRVLTGLDLSDWPAARP